MDTKGAELNISSGTVSITEALSRYVLKFAHDVPLGGHLGKEKTGCRLLRRFYWPTLFKDVAEFCRGCPTCQRSAQRRIKRAPLVPYQYTVVYRAGDHNKNADALSRAAR